MAALEAAGGFCFAFPSGGSGPAVAASGHCDRGAMLQVSGEDAVVACTVDAGVWDQRREACDKVERLGKDRRGTVAVGFILNDRG